MSAETWTDEKIREAFIYDGGESAYHDPINGEREQRRIAGAIFDEWLKRHDEAVRRAALTHPCTCREDVVCGACMSGATDPATAQVAEMSNIPGLRRAIEIIQGEDYPLSNGLARVDAMVSDLTDEIVMIEEEAQR